MNLESLEPRLALATGLLATLVSIVDDSGNNLLAASSADQAAPVAEGQQLTASVKLTRQPDAPVRVGFATPDPSEVDLVSSSSLLFTRTNWNIPQRLSIRGIEDGVADSTRQIPLRVFIATAARAPLTKPLWIESLDSGLLSPMIAASGTFKGSLEGTGSSGTVAATYVFDKGTATFRVTSSQLAGVRDKVISIDYAVNSANKIVVQAVRGFTPTGVKLDLTYRVGSDGVPGLSGTLTLSQPTLRKQAVFRVTAALVTTGVPRLEGYALSPAARANVGGSPEGVAIGADGAAWVANPGLNSVQRLVREQGVWKVTDTVPVGNGAKRIAVAPDGSAWVTNGADNTIQQIAKTNGVWMSRARVTVEANPSAIVVAKDGSVWVASSTVNVVQRITAAYGSPYISVTLPVDAGPVALAMAKDGAIWVVCASAHSIQRVSNVGGAWGIDAPIAVGSNPSSISAAIDGSLWIANTGSNSIQRIIQQGNAWKAQAPILVGSAVSSVTAHPDGSVWVTYVTGGTIGRFVATKTGWESQPLIPVGEPLSAIAVAPDGSLLVADAQTGTLNACTAVPS
ncbi:MAG: hypothetical protein WCJ31_07025 [Planctomycetia bacterium]